MSKMEAAGHTGFCRSFARSFTSDSIAISVLRSPMSPCASSKLKILQPSYVATSPENRPDSMMRFLADLMIVLKIVLVLLLDRTDGKQEIGKTSSFLSSLVASVAFWRTKLDFAIPDLLLCSRQLDECLLLVLKGRWLSGCLIGPCWSGNECVCRQRDLDIGCAFPASLAVKVLGGS